MTDIPNWAMEKARRLADLTTFPDGDSAIAGIARALLSERERAAGIAQVQALKSDQQPRRTKSLGLRRPAYAHEIGNEIAAAILADGGPDDPH